MYKVIMKKAGFTLLALSLLVGMLPMWLPMTMASAATEDSLVFNATEVTKYVDEELDKVADEIMAEYDSDFDRLTQICRYVASFDYGAGTSPGNFIVYGYGDCWASTNTICALAERMGLRNRKRDASRDPGAGSGHINAVVEVDGVPYIADAGFTGRAPRFFSVNARPGGFNVERLNSTECILTEYIGFDAEVVIPAERQAYHAMTDDIHTYDVVVGSNAFFGNTYVEKVIVNEGVKELRSGVFSGVPNLNQVVLPTSVSMIGEYAFYNSPILEKVTIEAGNPYYKMQDSLLLSSDGTVLVSCLNTMEGEVLLPESVAMIEKGAFSGCKKITKITFGGNIESISYWACLGAQNLREVVISEGTINIEGLAFYDTAVVYAGSGDSHLKIEIPRSVTRIADNAFDMPRFLTIIGHPGSYAEQYAKDKGATFLDIATNSISNPQSGEPDTEDADDSSDTGDPYSDNNNENPEAPESGYDNDDNDTDKDSDTDGEDGNTDGKDEDEDDPEATPPDPIEYQPSNLIFTPGITFDDISPSDWFYEAVQYVAGYGLFNGTSETTFSPDATMTRAMLVTVLYRIENGELRNENEDGGDVDAEKVPFSEGDGAKRWGLFSDVPDDIWYSEAVAWAAANGIVSGIGEGLFAPDMPITREQMAAILYRYEQHSGKTPSVVAAVIEFSDRDSISDYAIDPVNALVSQGIINGKPGNLFDPKGTATRCEVASVLHRFVEGSTATSPWLP